MGERQNGPLGLNLHLDGRFAPGFPRDGLPLRLVLPGPLGTAHWHSAAGASRSNAEAHYHSGGNNPKLEKFKRDLIALQVRSRENEHPPKHAVMGLKDSELGPIPNGNRMRKDVALLFTKMWGEIDRHYQTRGDSRATESIGVASGYRSAERDEKAWHRAFPKYYNHTLVERKATGYEFGKQALAIIFHYMNGKKAPPGFSGHTHGIAADLTTKERGTTWNVNSDHSHQVGWQDLALWLAG